jgi:hypothetical protein
VTIHLVKLSVGTDSVEDLASWQTERVKQMKAEKQKPELFHRTFMMPKRRDELLGGGSIYWVIKGVIQVRQRLLDLREGKRPDGTPCTLLILDRKLVHVRPVPRRAFQGWRYLGVEDAPQDISGDRRGNLDEMPPKLRRELAELGLL